MVKEYWLFVSHVGDMDRDIDLFTNEEYLERPSSYPYPFPPA